MPRTPARFTQADIARAIRAIQQTGANMAIEIRPDGAILIVPMKSLGQTTAFPVANPAMDEDDDIRL